MGGDPGAYSVELTLEAERVLLEYAPNWARHLSDAINAIRLYPHQGFIPDESGLRVVKFYPWVIAYQVVPPQRVVIVWIRPDSTRL